MADVRKLNTADTAFRQQLDEVLAWESVSDGAVNQTVNEVAVTRRCWNTRTASIVGRRAASLN